MIGRHLNVIQQHASFTDYGFFFSHESFVVIFGPYLKNPFLSGFLSLKHANESADGNCQENHQFVFVTFRATWFENFRYSYLTRQFY